MTFQTGKICRIGARRSNQDYTGYEILDKAACWVVADGLGGHIGGETASKTAVEVILKAFKAKPECSVEAIRHYLRTAQERILRLQQGNPNLSAMRTTVVVLVSDYKHVLWGHIGDSRLYYLKDGKIRFQTKDHSVTQSMAAAGEITTDQIRHHEDRNRLLRSIGQPGNFRPDIYRQKIQLSDGDVFLICSDGFWESVEETEMELDFAKAKVPGEWLQKMENRVLRKAEGDFDNYTALAVYFQSPLVSTIPGTAKKDSIIRELDSTVPETAKREPIASKPSPTARPPTDNFIRYSLPFLVLIIIILVLILLPPGDGRHDNKREPTEPPKPTISPEDENIPQEPAFIKFLKKKAKVTKNQGGYWEAEFEDGIVMIYIPEGNFILGAGSGPVNENPQRMAYLDGYWIGKYEVTFKQYDRFCEETVREKPSDEEWGREDRPVINVSWDEADRYCRWLSQKTGLHFKLPSEDQWEKAARGTDARKYPWGDKLNDGSKANFADSMHSPNKNINDGSKYTAPVGSYPGGVSPYGVLDMAGNVWEWCSDQPGNLCITKGGDWDTSKQACRAANRKGRSPSTKNKYCGFRVVMEMGSKDNGNAGDPVRNIE